MAISHKDIPDAERHNPKGFETAGNNTVQKKDGSGNIAWGAVQNPDIADDAVTRDKILDGEVTTSKIDDGAVTTGKLANDALSSNTSGRSKMQDFFVIGPKIKIGTASSTVTLDDSVANQAVPVVGLGTGARIINYTITGGALPNLTFQCMSNRSPNTYVVRLTTTGLSSAQREITINVQYIEGS